MRHRIVVTIGRQARRRLERWAKSCRDADLRTRILIVLKFREGLGSTTIADQLRVAPATAVRVAHRFLLRGEDGLLDGRHENGVPKIDDDLVQALAELIASQPTAHGMHRPTWTREALAIALTVKTRVEVSVSTVARMLQILGARWGRPRPIVICPWSRRRKAQRVAAIQQTLANLPSDEVAYYEDEVDIHLNPRIGPDWMLRGQQKLVVTPGKNRKRYLAGALASDESDLVFVSSDKKNSRLFIALLQRLLEKHVAAKVIHLVLDNFSIHDSKRVRKFIAATQGKIQLHFLPPYSPEHNKIERLWQRLHANVTRNHACPDVKALMRNVRRYLRSYAARLRRGCHARRAA